MNCYIVNATAIQNYQVLVLATDKNEAMEAVNHMDISQAYQHRDDFDIEDCREIRCPQHYPHLPTVKAADHL